MLQHFIFPSFPEFYLHFDSLYFLHYKVNRLNVILILHIFPSENNQHNNKNTNTAHTKKDIAFDNYSFQQSSGEEKQKASFQ